jgi:anti-anti-sigma factor
MTGELAPSSTEFSIETGEDGDVLVLRLVGELDLAGTATLAEAVRNAERSRHSRVLFDISGLRFIDSTGLGALVDANRRLSDRVRITRPAGQLADIFRLTGLDQTLPFE